MKYIVLLGDGMAGYPISSCDNKTSLEMAHTPNMDYLSQNGVVGRVKTVPDGFAPGSDVTNLNILGYDPSLYFTGRSPLEAANIGVELTSDQMSLRCNLVTLNGDSGMLLDQLADDLVMDDYSAGHISTEEATLIINRLDKILGTDRLKFHPGTSYRHLTVLSKYAGTVSATPPHDITGKKVGEFMPKGDNGRILENLMAESVIALRNDPVNIKRMSEGKKPANSIWLWGEGKKPTMPTFKELFGIDGAMISAVDLMKGMGHYAGFDIINVPGATGFVDTNFVGKVQYALESLNKSPFVYLHVEAPDEAAHMGSLKLKIEAIEKFDKYVVGGILEGLGIDEDFRILLLCDHFTPIETRTHSNDPVPYIIFDNLVREEKGVLYTEKESLSGALIENGWELMPTFLEKI